MSKAFIADILQELLDCTDVSAKQAVANLIAAIVKDMKKQDDFTLPSFDTSRVAKIEARRALGPRTGEPVKVKAGRTVRFKASRPSRRRFRKAMNRWGPSPG